MRPLALAGFDYHDLMSRRSHNSSTPDSPIGWYVHLPFCRTKCGYCDFYSLATIPELVESLVSAILRELSLRNPGRSVESIFIGGGTPTELPADALERLISTLCVSAGRFGEFTVEANPTSAAELNLSMLRRCGVDRLSFGAQSFDADDLRVLERLHDPRHIRECVHAAREAGFENINLDLIYGIPGQTAARWRDTLRRAIDLAPEHLSCYALMYEPGTSLTRRRRDGRLAPCDEDIEVEMFGLTIDELTAAGYEHYEISNFARPGRQCRHNVIYWENREYLGIGPSAVSFLDGRRTKNLPDVRRYVELAVRDPSALVIEDETLTPLERAGETAVQMLRLTRGIDAARFLALTGCNADTLFSAAVDRHRAAGLLESDADGIRLTRAGLLVANHVMQDFLVERRPARDLSLRVLAPPAAAVQSSG